MKVSHSYRILCLHGSTSNGYLFKQRLLPLIDYFNSRKNHLPTNNNKTVEFIFPSAPFEVINTDVPNNDSKQNKYVWWKIPLNIRSLNALTLDGIDASFKVIEDLYPFDGIISFSQAAMLSAIYISNKIINYDNQLDNIISTKPLKCILIGAGIPNSYKNTFETANTMITNNPYNIQHNIQTLHIVGEQDNINPTEMGKSLASLMNGKLYLHNDGHIIPLDDNSLQVMYEFMQI